MKKSANLLALLATLLLLLVGGTANAEEIAVMAFDGDDAVVQTLREAVRGQLVRTEGLDISEAGGDETIYDVFFVTGCEDENDNACLDAISEYLAVPSFVYGTVSEDGQALVRWYTQGEGIVREVKREFSGDRGEAEKIAKRLFGGETGTVAVTSNISGAIVIVDDKRVGLTPYEGELPIGAHTVVVEKEGYLNADPQQITLKVDETTPVNIDLEIDQAFVGGPGEGGMGTLTQVGIITASIGGALLIGGAVTGALVLGTQSDFDDIFKNDQITSADIEKAQDLQSDGDLLATTTTILLASGGALAATGIALIIVDLVGVEDDSADAEASNFSVFPLVSDEVTGAGFQLRF